VRPATEELHAAFCCATQYSIGIESIVLKREVNIARRAAAAFSSGATVTMPSAFFWFGQMMNQTLNAMTSASHMPMPMATNGFWNISAGIR
jgi:hypothetical protein